MADRCIFFDQQLEYLQICVIGLKDGEVESQPVIEPFSLGANFVKNCFFRIKRRNGDQLAGGQALVATRFVAF